MEFWSRPWRGMSTRAVMAHLDCGVCAGYRRKIKKMLAAPTVENTLLLHEVRSEFTDHLKQHSDCGTVEMKRDVMRTPDTRHFAGSYHWRVEYSRHPEGQGYRSNHNCSVIAPTLEIAARVVLEKFPDATLIKVFRGDQWGYDGLLMSPESEAAERAGRGG